MTKILYLKKVFAKIAIFSIKMSESKIFLRSTQATNIYKHISRNIGATMTATRKLAHGKVIVMSVLIIVFFCCKTCYILSNNVPIKCVGAVNPSRKNVQAHI